MMFDVIDEISESDARTSYPIRQRVWEGETAICPVVIADSDTYGRMLFLDGELQSASADEHIYHETLVHPVMLGAWMAAPTERLRVLVVGGGEGATVREVLKWNCVSEVKWVDIDVELVNICSEHLRWAPNVAHDRRVEFIGSDIRDVWRSVGLFDVIILDLPDPDGETGYLYSPDFWRDVRSHLSTRGRFVTHVGPVRPYGGVGEGVKRVLETTREAGIHMLAEGFYNIIIPSFQGTWGFWMWADGENPFAYGQVTPAPLSEPARIIDNELIRSWAMPPRLWRDALQDAILSVRERDMYRHR